MRVQKSVKCATKKPLGRRRIKANEEMIEEQVAVVAPEATDLLFEAEDVAELVAEVTGQEVEVTVEDDSVTFTVGEDEYTVEPEGDEEILEASRKVLTGKKAVAASRRIPTKKVAPARRIARR